MPLAIAMAIRQSFQQKNQLCFREKPKNKFFIGTATGSSSPPVLGASPTIANKSLEKSQTVGLRLRPTVDPQPVTVRSQTKPPVRHKTTGGTVGIPPSRRQS